MNSRSCSSYMSDDVGKSLSFNQPVDIHLEQVTEHLVVSPEGVYVLTVHPVWPLQPIGDVATRLDHDTRHTLVYGRLSTL